MNKIFPKGLTADKSPGIYCVVIHSRYYYIGSTLNLSSRKSHHLGNARRRVSHNKRVMSVLNKYEGCSVTFRVLESFESIEDDELRRVEENWIRRFLKEFTGKRVLNLRVECSTTNAGLTWTNGSVSKKRLQTLRSNALKQWECAQRRTAQAKRIRKLWRDPAYRERILEARRVTMDTPEYRKKLSRRALKQRASNPDRVGF